VPGSESITQRRLDGTGSKADDHDWDTVINGAIDVFNNLCTPGTQDCNSDDNFWRSLSNLTLNVHLPSSPPAYAPPALDPFGAGCASSAQFWSASQAAPIRRPIVNGNVVFRDYCANNNFASEGFIADSQVSGNLAFNGNQQYMVRDSTIGGAAGCPMGCGTWSTPAYRARPPRSSPASASRTRCCRRAR
jgi:hypothetical protein